MAQQQDSTASSTGQSLASVGWLDLHFEYARPEYTAMVQSVGFQPGWRVLDAGCGSGSYLPLLAELVGPSGTLTALDLAPENVTAARERTAGLRLASPVVADVGSVLDLPYPDDSFDGLWCASVIMYLNDDELLAALTEFRRVVRPGGLIAIKDADGALVSTRLLEPGRLQRLFEAGDRTRANQDRNTFRGPGLRTWLRRVGLTEIWSRTTLVERWPPYRPVEREFIRTAVAYFAGEGAKADLSPADRDEWARIGALGDAALDDPDDYCREGHVLAVGQVPLGWAGSHAAG